jgi:hypothetical protein
MAWPAIRTSCPSCRPACPCRPACLAPWSPTMVWGILVWICFDASERDWILVADEGLGDFECGPSSGHGVGARGRVAG